MANCFAFLILLNQLGNGAATNHHFEQVCRRITLNFLVVSLLGLYGKFLVVRTPKHRCLHCTNWHLHYYASTYYAAATATRRVMIWRRVVMVVMLRRMVMVVMLRRVVVMLRIVVVMILVLRRHFLLAVHSTK